MSLKDNIAYLLKKISFANLLQTYIKKIIFIHRTIKIKAMIVL